MMKHFDENKKVLLNLKEILECFICDYSSYQAVSALNV
jgi:hypothetical protein